MTTTTSTSTSVSTRKQDGCYLKNGSAANVEYADIAAALQAGITAYEALSSAQKTSEKTTATIFLIPFTKTYTTTTTTTYSTDSETGLITVTNISRVVADPVVTTRTQIAILTAMGGAVSGKRLRDGIQGALQYESEYSDIDHDGTLDKFKITYKIGTTWSNNTISGTVTTSSKTLAVGKRVPTLSAPSGHTYVVKGATTSAGAYTSTVPTTMPAYDFTIYVLKQTKVTLTVAMDGWTVGDTAASPVATTTPAAAATASGVTISYKYYDSDKANETTTKPSTAGTYFVRGFLTGGVYKDTTSAYTQFVIAASG